jgi:hypothetical protein
MKEHIFVYGIPLSIICLLAMPPAFNERSWKRFFIAAFLSAVGILLPLFVFGMSGLMVPDWKGVCRFGWLDCFHTGKLALTPLVLWASAALYSLDILRVVNRTRPWIVLGIFIGAVVSGICFIYGLFPTMGPMGLGRIGWFLLVPFYVALWYAVRACQLICIAALPLRAYLWTLLGSLPFWIGGVIWARKTFSALPDQPPSCFVVTAASRGHEPLVGPFEQIIHHGRPHRANRQLLTLWQFEELWRSRAPGSHAAFRRVYNLAGPAVARRITSPWLADLTYFALKPVEWVARKIIGQ